MTRRFSPPLLLSSRAASTSPRHCNKINSHELQDSDKEWALSCTNPTTGSFRKGRVHSTWGPTFRRCKDSHKERSESESQLKEELDMFINCDFPVLRLVVGLSESGRGKGAQTRANLSSRHPRGLQPGHLFLQPGSLVR